MLIPVHARAFKNDVKRLKKRGKDMSKLRVLLSLLIEERPIPQSYRDHPLRGDWAGFRDIHMEPDWILIYRVRGNGFLKHMVRNIVGVLLEAGKGNLGAAAIEARLKPGCKIPSGPSAPARGLFLVSVEYADRAAHGPQLVS